MEYIWMEKTGSPPRPFEDYDPLTLAAFLGELGAILDKGESTEKTKRTAGRWGVPTLGATKDTSNYDKAFTTGDPIADEWERQLSNGENPKW